MPSVTSVSTTAGQLASNLALAWTGSTRASPGAASFAFGRALRDLRDAGVREAHVFMAAPAALALLLGASVNAGPAMTLYFTANGQYQRSVRLSA